MDKAAMAAEVAEEASFDGPFLDYMVDCETGSLDPEHGVMFQLAAVRFSLDGKTIAPERATFRMALQEDMPGRTWSNGTRDFWLEQGDLYGQIVKEAQTSRAVLEAFVDWVCQDQSSCWKRRFWSKPSHFDFCYVESYLRQAGIMSPFHFRETTDLNSYIRGRGHWNGKEFWAGIEPVGTAHDALNDCFYQIRGLFAA
jgi:hypothetical protein